MSSAKSSKGVSQRRNALNEANGVLSRLERKLTKLKKRDAELEEEIEKAEAKIKAHIAEHGDLKEEEQKISSEAEEIRSKVQTR